MKKTPKATGYMRAFVGEIRITTGGKTQVFTELNVEKELVNGEWVDVTPKPQPAKKVSSKVVKERK